MSPWRSASNTTVEPRLDTTSASIPEAASRWRRTSVRTYCSVKVFAPSFRLRTSDCGLREDLAAEAGLPDRRRECRGADRPHARRTNARGDHRRGERQLDLAEDLSAGHAHAACGLDGGRIDAAQAGDRVANDRQDRIERQ